MAEVYVMRIRIKFSKYDTLRFVGHLDIMRYFQRLLRRADIPMKYTEGFHPHQILSFAQPLGLGLSSDGEYLDAELTEDMDTAVIKDKLNAAVSYGIYIVDVVRLADREANKKLMTSMALISRALYMLILKDGPEDKYREFDKFAAGLKALYEKENINVIKKTKKGEKEINLKDFTYEIYLLNDEIPVPVFVSDNCVPVAQKENIAFQTEHAPEFENGRRLLISLSAGSETNIAPDFFIESMISLSGAALLKEDFRIHRMELYGGDAKGSIPLCRIL